VLLGVHPSTVRGWANHGDLPTHRTAGQHRRFRRVDIEAWAASRREAQASPSEMIVQNALGRARLQAAEGRLNEFGWYRQFSEHQRRELREAGRTLLTLLLRYLGDEGEHALEEARAIGATYERLGREAGLSLSDRVQVFLYFRDFLYDSVVDVHQSQQRPARDWANTHRRIAAFTNAVLLALIAAHEAAAH
jgi:excisionase family DNA binding protein